MGDPGSEVQQQELPALARARLQQKGAEAGQCADEEHAAVPGAVARPPMKTAEIAAADAPQPITSPVKLFTRESSATSSSAKSGRIGTNAMRASESMKRRE